MKALLSVAVCLVLATGPAMAADTTVKGLIAQAKAAGTVKVFSSHLGETTGTLTDIGGDVLCVRTAASAGKAVEYCFPYVAVELVVKPGTGAHNDFTSIWIRGAR